MELDFDSVKALSSPTRIRILSEIMERESTPTDLSRSLGRSKSTVSSHLSKLEEAGLVEKDEQEGRRRVTYSPTRKAEAILKGKERKVKFSVASSAITGFAGVALLGHRFWPFSRDQMPAAESGALQAGGDAATTAASSGQSVPLMEWAVIGLGLLALGAAIAGLMYVFVLYQMPNSQVLNVKNCRDIHEEICSGFIPTRVHQY